MKPNKFDQVYDISLAFITDKDTELDNINQNFFRLRQVIHGKTYTLTISAPKDGNDYVIMNSPPAKSIKYSQAKKHGPLGEINFYCDQNLLLHYRSRHPVAPALAGQDNISQEKMRRFFNRGFFRLVDMIESRQRNKIILRDNRKEIYNTVHEISQQKTR